MHDRVRCYGNRCKAWASKGTRWLPCSACSSGVRRARWWASRGQSALWQWREAGLPAEPPRSLASFWMSWLGPCPRGVLCGRRRCSARARWRGLHRPGLCRRLLLALHLDNRPAAPAGLRARLPVQRGHGGERGEAARGGVRAAHHGGLRRRGGGRLPSGRAAAPTWNWCPSTSTWASRSPRRRASAPPLAACSVR